ncbi:MAG: Fe-S-binding domain-containing protein [Phycisphaeraceae bacterium]|nr:Fe-S-binding domain-containing protein [Phycisphaeraceae bacterium]
MILAQSIPKMSGSSLLPILVVVPLLAGIVLALAPGMSAAVVRRFSLITSLFVFLVSVYAARFGFDWSNPGATNLPWSTPWIEGFGLSFSFGVDAISMWLLLLTTFLMPLVIWGSFSAVTERVRGFYAWLLVLEAAMIGVFAATDLIFFYICFEFTLIPLYFLIGIYGSTQRLKAARVFFLYTFTGSMLALAGLLYVAWQHAEQAGFWSFSIVRLTDQAQQMTLSQQTWVMLAMLAGFAVKVPLFPVHTWLPLAHTEAPTAGSVILAGVLLKLGTYALLRLTIPMAHLAVIEYAGVIGVFAVIGILYTALICWVQRDIKKLIAYSSVSHLGFCVLGMFALNKEGMGGSVMYMINHGLSTGALFLCVGMIYERFHTRQMADMSGLVRPMPVWSFYMVFFCLASVGLPGLNGFVGEFLTLIGAFAADDVLGPPYAAAAAAGMVLAAIYILYMIGRVVFGPTRVPHAHDVPTCDGKQCLDLNLREILTLLPLAIACLWLGLRPAPVLQSLEPSLAEINRAGVIARGFSVARPNLTDAGPTPPSPSREGPGAVLPSPEPDPDPAARNPDPDPRIPSS